MKDKPVNEQEIGKQMLSETASFAETSSCRRKFILHYFGESFDEKGCNEYCDLDKLLSRIDTHAAYLATQPVSHEMPLFWIVE